MTTTPTPKFLSNAGELDNRNRAEMARLDAELAAMEATTDEDEDETR